MFTNETFRNALIDDVLVARVLCSLALFYSKSLCGKLCVSVGGFAIVLHTHNSAKNCGAIFLLSFLRVGHLHFMRILARCDCRRWVSIRGKWLRGRVCRADWEGRGILVPPYRKYSRDRVMPLTPKCVAVLAINSSVRRSEHYPVITSSSQQKPRATDVCWSHTYLYNYNALMAAPVAFNAHLVHIS